MQPSRGIVTLAFAAVVVASEPWPTGRLASKPPVPPMGVNSYDATAGAYSFEQAVAAAAFMGKGSLPSLDTLVLDGGWSSCPGGNASMDGNGLPTPCPSKYGGRSLAQVAEAVYSAGARGFGVWMIRGIPREAVEKNLPIANSTFRARDAARLDRNCSWDSANYGVRDNAAGRAWYASVFETARRGNLSFLKMDCLFPSTPSGPYYGPEVRMFAEAMREGSARTGHSVTVSFSPGGPAVSVDNATAIASGMMATQYRVTNDLWDVWRVGSRVTYPSGVWSKVDDARRFAAFFGRNGTFPDLDMLPLGRLGAHGNARGGITRVSGPATPTQLSPSEQQYLAALWLIVRAPLMLGAFVPLDAAAHPSDALVLRLLGNRAAIDVSRCAAGSREVAASGGIAWASVPTDCGVTALGSERNVALLNRGDAAATVSVALAALGLGGSDGPLAGCWCAADIWTGSPVPGAPIPAPGALAVQLQPRSAALLRVAPASSCSACAAGAWQTGLAQA